MAPNVNLMGILNNIKNNERKLNSQPYTRDFGTYIGRFRPRSHGISGSVSTKTLIFSKIRIFQGWIYNIYERMTIYREHYKLLLFVK